jgi:tetratricopeptide (TPR) repeat protein
LTDAVTTHDVGATVVISAIGGAGGIGKTALALHWARQQLHRFPDGQLYVDLRGFDPSGLPTPADGVVRDFLTALGVAPDEVPAEPDAQAALYRSRVAGKRMLIVLDNARDAEQVRPLLPGSPTCTVLVTSRHRLAGLTLHGARLLDLDVLPEPDAYDLLVRLLGLERLVDEPAAVAELLAVCAGLPLAVRIVAARAAHHSTFPLAVLAEELREVSTRLRKLRGDRRDPHFNLRVVLSWSLHALSGEQIGLFGLLGIAPGPDISLPAAACLADQSEADVGDVLWELEHASLVQQHMPGRYRMHDLIRLHAIETAHHDLAEGIRFAATERLLQYYLGTALTADQWVRSVQGHTPPVGGRFAGREHALAWLDVERANLVSAVADAANTGRNQLAVALALGLAEFLSWRRLDDWVPVAQVAVRAAERMQDRRLLNAWAFTNLGHALQSVRKFEEAIAAHTTAGDIYRETGDRHAEGNAWGKAGLVLQGMRRFNEAITAHTAAATLFRETSDRHSEGAALANVGICSVELERLGEARRAWEQAMAAFEDTHDGEMAQTVRGWWPVAGRGRGDRAGGVAVAVLDPAAPSGRGGVPGDRAAVSDARFAGAVAGNGGAADCDAGPGEVDLRAGGWRRGPGTSFGRRPGTRGHRVVGAGADRSHPGRRDRGR